MLPPVASYVPNTMIEWEGRLAAVVLLQGCNFRCPFCHSSQLIPAGEADDTVPWDELACRIAEDRDWLDGIVVSGGEPTIHAGLGELLSRLREHGLPVKLDTNGSAPGRLKELIEGGLVQHLAVDVKAPLTEESYARATGRQGALRGIRESLEVLRAARVSYELRTTLFPLVFDESGLLELAGDLAWAGRWYLQGFRPVGCLDPEMEKLPPTDRTWLESMAERCRQIASGCRARREGA